jgi:hypothetical protein
MSQEAVEALRKGQELLKEEVNLLKTQMSLIIQIQLRGKDNPSSCSPQAYPAPQVPRPWVIPLHQQQPRQQALQPFNNKNRVQRRPQFDPIPISNAELLPSLIERNVVQTRAPPRVPATLPWWYKIDCFCVFHQGAHGHDIEDFWVLKSEVQRLTRANVISFKICIPRRQKHQSWYLDSCCSHHMTGERCMFQSLTLQEGGSVGFEGKQKGKIIGICTVGNSSLSINNVWLVDGLKHNLLSISQFCDSGYVVMFDKNTIPEHLSELHPVNEVNTKGR